MPRGVVAVSPAPRAWEEEEPACFICFDKDPRHTGTGRPDTLRTGLCSCTNLAVHISCLESFVNTSALSDLPIPSRLKCRVCATPYRLTHHVLPVAADEPFRSGNACVERVLRRCIHDEERLARTASALRIAMLLLVMLHVPLIALAALFSWGESIVRLGIWGLMVPLGLFVLWFATCAPSEWFNLTKYRLQHQQQQDHRLSHLLPTSQPRPVRPSMERRFSENVSPVGSPQRRVQLYPPPFSISVGTPVLPISRASSTTDSVAPAECGERRQRLSRLQVSEPQTKPAEAVVLAVECADLPPHPAHTLQPQPQPPQPPSHHPYVHSLTVSDLDV